MNFSRFYYLIILLLLLPTYASAQLFDDSEQRFDFKAANKQFDQINIQLSTSELDIVALRQAVTDLNSLSDQAKVCVEQASARLNIIDDLIRGVKPKTPETSIAQTVDPSSNIKYLIERREVYNREIAECRLLMLRIKGSVTAFNKTIDRLSTSIILERYTPIWQIFSTTSQDVFTNINISQLFENPPWFDLFINLFLTLLAILSVNFVIRARFTATKYLNIKPETAQKLRWRAIITFIILWFGVSVNKIATPYQFDQAVLDLSRMLFLSIVSLSLTWLAWPLTNIKLVKKITPIAPTVIKFLLLSLLIFMITAELLG